MLALSGRSADLATRLGVRAPLVAGSVIGGVGVALLATAGPGDSYLSAVLPGMTLLGIGLVILVPTLTATVMSSAPAELVGVASGVNNGVSRAAGLMAVAAIPAAVGLAGASYADPELMTAAFRGAMLICAGLLVAGGALAAFLLPRPVAKPDDVATEEAGETAAPCPAPGLPPAHGH
jgi:MFS family permease